MEAIKMSRCECEHHCHCHDAVENCECGNCKEGTCKCQDGDLSNIDPRLEKLKSFLD